MKSLVVCPTYGRIPYLGRMLASFLSQDWDDKHLVIINDDKNVTLHCDYLNVTIINCNRKMTVAEKRNIGISVGNYDLILPLDDDDIFLPNRISNHISKYDENKAYRNIPCYVIYGDEFSIGNSSPNSISFKKEEWYNVGGYKIPEDTTSVPAEDIKICNDLKDQNILLEENDNNNIDFVYHYGGVNYHLSCIPHDTIDKIAYQQLVDMKLEGGHYWIEPDYDKLNMIHDLVQHYKHINTPFKVKHGGNCQISIDK